MPGNVGPMEIILVLVIALLVLGPKKLPEVGRSVGKGIREFRDGISGLGDDHKDDDDAELPAVNSSPPSSTEP
jgi:sec-independent protein translocase protein TatA